MHALNLDSLHWVDIKISSELSRYLYKEDIKDIGRVKYVVSTSYIHPRTVMYWPPWQPNTWNSICFVASPSQTRIFSNGVKVAEGEGVLEEFPRDENFNILGNCKEKERFLTFGAATDFNIWNRVLTNDEIYLWSNFEILNNGKIFDWNLAELELEGVEVVDTSLGSIQMEDWIATSKGYLSYISSQFLSFEAGLYLCEDLNGHIAVPGDNTNIGKWKSVVKRHEVLCNYRFFLG